MSEGRVAQLGVRFRLLRSGAKQYHDMSERFRHFFALLTVGFSLKSGPTMFNFSASSAIPTLASGFSVWRSA